MTRWPRAFSSDAARAQAATRAIARSLSYFSSCARSQTVAALECSLIGPGRTSSLIGKTGLHRREHRAGDLVEEGVDLLLGLAGDRHLVRHDHVGDRKVVLLRVLAQLLHRRVRIFRLALLRRLVALPLDEAAADGIVFLLVERLVAGHQLARHGVGVREIALRRVVDDIGERQIEGLVAELHRIGLLRLGDHLVEEAAGRRSPAPCRRGRRARRARCRGPCRWRSGCRKDAP